VISPVVADFLLAAGGFVGLATKLYALLDSSTTWSRTSSGFNALLYPLTALLPFASLGLWWTFATSAFNWFIWIGIFVWRAPDDEDWLGRKGF
jgi:hypothetical protein